METNLKKIDLTGTEKWREYVFSDDFTYRVVNPKTLYISPRGSHRVVDAFGIAHHLADWRVLRWDGEVVF